MSHIRRINLTKEEVKNFYKLNARDFAYESEKEEYKFFNLGIKRFYICSLTEEVEDIEFSSREALDEYTKELEDWEYYTKVELEFLLIMEK